MREEIIFCLLLNVHFIYSLSSQIYKLLSLEWKVFYRLNFFTYIFSKYVFWFEFSSLYVVLLLILKRCLNTSYSRLKSKEGSVTFTNKDSLEEIPKILNNHVFIFMLSLCRKYLQNWPKYAWVMLTPVKNNVTSNKYWSVSEYTLTLFNPIWGGGYR